MTKGKGLRFCLATFDADSFKQKAVALRVGISESDAEQPVHSHRKGQLVLVLNGWVTCNAPGAMWLAPPQSGVWIPSGVPHSNYVTDNAELCFLLIEPKAAAMPDQCCTLEITPLVRELILELASEPQNYAKNSSTARLADLLIERVSQAKQEPLHLPVSDHPKIKTMAKALQKDPSDRRTLPQWGKTLGMSDRTLARLVQQETGMTFGRWRQQLHIIISIRQLASGNSVQEVAGNLGYDSVAAFITMFKKAMGLPPGKYLAGMRGI